MFSCWCGSSQLQFSPVFENSLHISEAPSQASILRKSFLRQRNFVVVNKFEHLQYHRVHTCLYKTPRDNFLFRRVFSLKLVSECKKSLFLFEKTFRVLQFSRLVAKKCKMRNNFRSQNLQNLKNFIIISNASSIVNVVTSIAFVIDYLLIGVVEMFYPFLRFCRNLSRFLPVVSMKAGVVHSHQIMQNFTAQSSWPADIFSMSQHEKNSFFKVRVSFFVSKIAKIVIFTLKVVWTKSFSLFIHSEKNSPKTKSYRHQFV